MPGVIYKKEREVLEYLAQFQRQFGYSPTLKEIAGATGHRSNSTVHSLIKSLVDKGYIQKVDGNNRVLKIVDQKVTFSLLGSTASIELPLMGYIAAGKPLEPHSDPNATFHVSASMISGKKTAYVLQVKGNSMIEDGIFDGDFVVIEKAETATNGDIVVALVDNNMATLKRFFNENGKIVLKPANAEMAPIYPNTLLIQGKAVGIVRKFS
ncbi:MAG: repressor LexA [Candidatus Levybacteria bacterium RIFCSPLOWO2_01_FULL_39_24]|nr:MAG: repressor LexA [Candidatus Levybacteria bacterium RIFCSPHIGHO2_01_FULL_40_16]OGH28683.1 MAG: repressor LexA [Candidatus Levybacteria bacterium RIFCSPHIGHO2_12_FULL_39_9]OGH46446.1 MAG: repressor LexA [Candidatus Levybacteria bacterium RIFCSPLOWO2_01_FULL_39_24]